MAFEGLDAQAQLSCQSKKVNLWRQEAWPQASVTARRSGGAIPSTWYAPGPVRFIWADGRTAASPITSTNARTRPAQPLQRLAPASVARALRGSVWLCLARAVSQEFKECISTEAGSTKCIDLQQDYMECLHHKKEVRGPPLRHTHPLAPLSHPLARLSRARSLTPLAYAPCIVCFPQTTRFNVMNAERIRKVNAGEPTPKLVNDQIKAGELKVPWTNAS